MSADLPSITLPLPGHNMRLVGPITVLFRQSQSLLSFIAKLTSFFIALLSFFWSSELLKSKALIVPGISVIGIKTEDLFISGESLLIALEFTKSKALIIPGNSITRIKTDG